MRKTRPAFGAEAFQDGDRRAFQVDEARHRIGDADAADDQRRQAHQREELHEAVDVAPQTRRGVVARADRPSRLGKALRCQGAEVSDGGEIVGAVRQADAIDPTDKAAGPDQAGLLQRLQRDDGARPEAHAAEEPVGLGAYHPADLHDCLAEPHLVARRKTEPVKQIRRDEHAEAAIRRRQPRLGVGAAVLQRQRAAMRIGRVDRLQLDQSLILAVVAPQHRASRRHPAELARLAEEGELLFVRGLVEERIGDVAADDDAALRFKPGGQAARDGIDAGDGGDAERDAGDEDIEPGKPAAQFA